MGRIVKGARVGSSIHIALPATPVEPRTSDVADIDAFENRLFTEEFDRSPIQELPPPSLPDRSQVVAEIESLARDVVTDAREILTKAHEDALAMIADAEANVAKIEGDAKTLGFEQGEKDSRASVDAEMADMLSTMRGLVDMARDERHKIISDAEHEIVRLAAAIAERIIHRTVADDDGVVLESVRAAIARITSRERVVVRINPADLETIRAHRERVTAGADIEHLKIVEDQRVDRGGVIVETESGTIDARISAQIRETHRLLEIDEPLEVRESPESSILTTQAKAG